MHRRVNQRGFLMVGVVILIVVVAFLAVALSSMLASNVSTTVNNMGSMQALFEAESGLEYEQRNLARNLDWYRSSTDPMATTTQSVGAGSFTTSTYLPTTMLRRNLTNNGLVICVYSVDRFPSSGNLQIEDDVLAGAEYVTYTSTTTSHASCGNQPAFVTTLANRGSTIGTIATTAAVHSRGDLVYPVTTLSAALAASCTTPASFQIVANSKFLSAGTVDIEGEEIGYARATTAGAVTTLTGVRRCLNPGGPVAHPAGRPVTPILNGSISADFEAEAIATGTDGVAVREMRKTIQR